MGSTIACVIVIQQLWWFGFVILIPHTINFLLWILWLFLMRKHPEVYLDSKRSHAKFGQTRPDGTLQVPNRLTLKWIPNYYFRLRENQSVNLQYSITSIFCLIALVIF